MTEARGAGFPVLDRVPGQEHAIAFLRQAAARPHHAYVLAGPEGGGKQLAANDRAASCLPPPSGPASTYAWCGRAAAWRRNAIACS